MLRALLRRLPQAQFAFLGDTARLPYGSKSRRTIAATLLRACSSSSASRVPSFVVIACNTASALALDAIQAASPVPVLGVIEPGASAAKAASRTATCWSSPPTPPSKAMLTPPPAQARGLRALEKACPLLVPLVEEGWTDHPVTAEVIRIYLAELIADATAHGLNADTLVLGCTHYPLLRPLIERAVPAGMKVIDSADAAADAAVHLLAAHAPSVSQPIRPNQPPLRFFATDSVDKFERLGSRFLDRSVGKVELVDLGG